MQDLLGSKFVLEFVSGPGKGFFEVAAAQLIGQRDIGVLDALEVLEVGKGFGRPQFVMHVDFGIQSLDFVEDGGQFVVLRSDELRSCLGDVRITGDDRGNRLADKAHFLVGQNRLIMEGGPVIRMPFNTLSAAFSRLAFAIAALATMRADLIKPPSSSITTATPSAGQSSADPVVAFI